MLNNFKANKIPMKSPKNIFLIKSNKKNYGTVNTKTSKIFNITITRSDYNIIFRINPPRIC